METLKNSLNRLREEEVQFLLRARAWKFHRCELAVQDESMKEDIRVAFLILAHNQPHHLNRMINRLNHQNFDLFIHIDEKSDMSQFSRMPLPANAQFSKERFKIYHGGFSIVRAMISLLRQAYEDPDVDYFYFLSGWDYPIKTAGYIYEFLRQSHPCNFMSFYPLVGKAVLTENIQKYHFIDIVEQAPEPLHTPLRVLQFITRNIPLNRTFLPGFTPFRGSAWFCINRESVAYILDFLQQAEAEQFINYFQTTSCADEIFFHTILLNSGCAKYCTGYQEFVAAQAQSQLLLNENQAYHHYIDWAAKRENPALLDLGDLEKLKQTPAMFARKFHEQKSAAVLDAIDQMIAQNEQPLTS